MSTTSNAYTVYNRTLAWARGGGDPVPLSEGELREPITSEEVWDSYGLVPATPAPGLLNDLDAAGDVELWKRRALSAVAGSATKFELAVPADLAQVVPPEAGDYLPGTTAFGSAAPVLEAPPAPATGYAPVLEDAAGTAYVMDANVWLVDSRRNTVEFPWGVPGWVVPPLTLTFFKYTGATGGVIPDPLVLGALHASTVDTAAGALAIAPANATSVTIAAVGTPTTVAGSLAVDGDLVVTGTQTVTSTESQTVLIADPHLYLNKNYTTVAGATGGLIVNYLPTATRTTTAGAGVFVAGVVGVSNPTVTTQDPATFAAGDLIQISGAADVMNNGLFEVSTHVGALLEIRGVGTFATVEDFTQTQFAANAGDVGAAIVKVTVSVARAGADGAWEAGAGAATALTFRDLVDVSSIQSMTNKSFGDAVDVTGALTVGGSVDAVALTDGTATMTGGALSGLASVTSTTLTDGIATMTGGALTGISSVSSTGALGLSPTAANCNINAPLHVVNATASTSKTTGALIVDGGVGVSGVSYMANTVFVMPSSSVTITESGGVSGGFLFQKTTATVQRFDFILDSATRDFTIKDVTGNHMGYRHKVTNVIELGDATVKTSIINVTDATSATSGGLICAGGISSQKTIWAGTGMRADSLDTETAVVLTLGGIIATSVTVGKTGGYVMMAGPVYHSYPAGLYADAVTSGSYTGLATVPAPYIGIWTERTDVVGIWSVNVGTNGIIQYTGATSRWHSIVVIFGINSIAAGTLTLIIQKDVAGNGMYSTIGGNSMDKFLSGGSDAGSVCIQTVSQSNQNDKYRILLIGSSDTLSLTITSAMITFNAFS